MLMQQNKYMKDTDQIWEEIIWQKTGVWTWRKKEKLYGS